METTKHEDGAQGDLGTKLEAATEKARQICQSLQDKTTAAARAADEAVRGHPYQAIGIAFGMGVLIGVLAGWRRRD